MTDQLHQPQRPPTVYHAIESGVVQATLDVLDKNYMQYHECLTWGITSLPPETYRRFDGTEPLLDYQQSFFDSREDPSFIQHLQFFFNNIHAFQLSQLSRAQLKSLVDYYTLICDLIFPQDIANHIQLLGFQHAPLPPEVIQRYQNMIHQSAHSLSSIANRVMADTLDPLEDIPDLVFELKNIDIPRYRSVVLSDAGAPYYFSLSDWTKALQNTMHLVQQIVHILLYDSWLQYIVTRPEISYMKQLTSAQPRVPSGTYLKKLADFYLQYFCLQYGTHSYSIQLNNMHFLARAFRLMGKGNYPHGPLLPRYIHENKHVTQTVLNSQLHLRRPRPEPLPPARIPRLPSDVLRRILLDELQPWKKILWPVMV